MTDFAEHLKLYEEMLVKYRTQALEAKNAHYNAAQRYGIYARLLGISSAVLAAVVGTGILATLEEDVATEWKLVAGVLSTLVAVLTALATFMKAAEKSELHRLAGVKYSATVRALDGDEIVLPDSHERLTAKIREIEDLFNDAASNAPLLSDKDRQKGREETEWIGRRL